MKVLLINKFYHIVGGVDRYFFGIREVLEKKRHISGIFSMKHHQNLLSRWDKYFVSNISFKDTSFKKGIKIVGRIIYNFEANGKIKKLCNEFQPDIAYAFSIYHHISPSVYIELRKRNIPIIQFIGDYHIISPNYNMFHDGAICEITKPSRYYKAIFHKCVKNSYLASITEVSEKYIHSFLGWEKNYIDYYIVPSEFMKNKLIEYGFPSKKISYLPHFVDCDKYKPNYNKGHYILYFGRLSPEKGVNFLINSMKTLRHIQLIIIGRGDAEYEKLLREQARNMENIKFLGFKDGISLKKIINNSKFTILPSLWYEVFGLSLLESFASGKPVIASNIGGIPELVQDGRNGFLFEPGNIEDCANKINKLWNNPALCRKMGKNARKYVEEKFGPEEHYEKLMAIYKSAIAKHS